MESKRGEVETKYRAWVASLGRLSPRQAAEAEVLYVLAAQMDSARLADPASWPAAISRDLRQQARLLREREDSSAASSTLDDVDEVAAARQARRAKLGGSTQ